MWFLRLCACVCSFVLLLMLLDTDDAECVEYMYEHFCRKFKQAKCDFINILSIAKRRN